MREALWIRTRLILSVAALAASLPAHAEPATSPQQIVQERSTAAVAAEIGQLVIERAQLRVSVDVLREQLAKSEERVRALEQQLGATR